MCAWRRCQPHQRLGDDPEHALGADHGRGQVVSGVAQARRPPVQTMRPGSTTSRPRTWIRGDAVLEAVRPAGVLGNVSADGAGPLARGIRREEVAMASVSPSSEVDHARFDQRGAVFPVDLEDAVHPGQADDDPACWGTAPPESPVPAPRATTGSQPGEPGERSRRPAGRSSAGPRRRAAVSTAPSTLPSYS